MDRGLADQPSSLAPVPAYPRRAVEQYLADARVRWDELRQSLTAAHARRDVAQSAVESADESQRLLGSMMVEAQRDLAARRAHAEAAAASILASADEEAERIVSSARRLATGTIATDLDPAALNGTGADLPPAAVAASGDAPAGEVPADDGRDDDGPSEDQEEPGWVPPRHIGSTPIDAAAAAALTSSEEAQADAVAATAADLGAIELWPARRPVSAALESIGWRRRQGEDELIGVRPGDESYFSRLRDEYRADGSLNTWFEPA